MVVLENASCHTGHAFESRLDAWAERGLLVYHRPANSPELNAIERLWKKLKYQLLPVDARERLKPLQGTLTTTLKSFDETTYLPSPHHYGMTCIEVLSSGCWQNRMLMRFRLIRLCQKILHMCLAVERRSKHAELNTDTVYPHNSGCRECQSRL